MARGWPTTWQDERVNWAAELGLPAVQLYVTASNTRAMRFYERQGFSPAQVIMRTLLPVG